MNSYNEKQIIVYDKESGTISQIMTCHSTNISIEKLGLDKVYDTNKIGFLIEDNKFVNIKKDRVFEGKITSLLALQEQQTPKFSSSDNLFEDVQYKRLAEHVALITPWNRQCGIANYSRDLVDNLQCKVTVFCGKEDNPEYNNPKVKVVPCWTNRDSSYSYLVELLKKHKVDTAHVQYNHDLMNAGQLKNFGNDLKESGIRTIMTHHSTKGGVDIFGKYYDTIVVHTEPSAQDLIGENTKKEQIEIIPIGTKGLIKNKEKKIACIEKNIDYTRPIISNFGFLLPQKGIKEQIKALQLIKRKYDNILLLVVCAIHREQQNEGVSERYYEECKELTNDLNLNDNVIFMTEYLPYNEIFDYLHCSDLIVMPYVNAAAQANSSAGRTVLISSRPFITTDVEIFCDFKDVAPQVPARDIEALSDKILEILNDKNKQSIILENMHRFLEETSWKNVARKHMKMYKTFGDIKIDIEGQVYSYFSSSVVNRNMACALDDLGVDISLKSVNLAENTNYKLGDKSEDIVKRPQTGVIHVQHQFPPKFDLDGKTKIVYLMAETSVPDEWVEKIEASDIDYIWVYSSHSKDLIRKSGITKPVEVIRCGYDKRLFNENVIPVDLGNIRDSYTKRAVNIDENTFVFMFVGHAQERKNFNTIFKSYLKEFSQDDNVCFVIKSYDGGEIHKTILELVEYVTKIDGKENLPKYLYIYEDTDPEILPMYYRAANVLVQASRAEGFGKPIIEAQAMGIPSIAVAFSGPKDFCTDKNAFLVPFKLVRSSYHVQSKDQDSLWADTSEDDLKQTMRYCFENPEEVKKRGKQALYDSRKWSTEETAFDIIDFVRKYDL